MTCECWKKVEDGIKESLIKNPPFKKPLERVEFKSLAFVVEDLDFKTYTSSVVEIRLKGQKKAIPRTVIHTYCPFCGKPHKEEANDQPG